jgi:hypothetical protein
MRGRRHCGSRAEDTVVARDEIIAEERKEGRRDRRQRIVDGGGQKATPAFSRTRKHQGLVVIILPSSTYCL